MKKAFALICIICMVFSVGMAHAEMEYYNEYRWTGIVICTNASVRESPSTSAKRYGQIHNGNVCTIVGEQDGWYLIDLATTGLNVPDGIGYVKRGLIKKTPCWIVLTKYTYIYSDPWYSDQENGEFVADTPLLVKSENDEFYCVQHAKGQAGSSFVRKRDVGAFTPDCEPSYAVIAGGQVNVYSYENWSVIDSLNTLSLVQVFSWDEDFCYVMYEKDGDIIYGYIETNFVQPVIN